MRAQLSNESYDSISQQQKKAAFPDIQIRTMEILFVVLGNERQAA